MKKILYTLLAGAIALASCSKSDEMPTAPQNESTTFTLSIDEPTVQAATRATITPVRYIMEVWNQDGTIAEKVFEDGTNHAEITSGKSFTAILDKTKAYTCLFWADDNATFNAASLTNISLNTDMDMNEAYHAKISVAIGRNLAIAVKLNRAVSKIVLHETEVVATDSELTLTFSSIYPTFSVLAGEAIGEASTLTKTVNPDATTNIIKTLYFFAKKESALTDLAFIYALEPARTVSNIPYKLNHATTIKGEYSTLSIFSFTVSANDEWETPDNDVELPMS